MINSLSKNISVKIAYTNINGDSSLPPILFIHGRGSTKDTWESAMQAEIRNSRYAIDLRGHGESIYDGVDFSFKAMQQDILQFLNEHNIEKFIIVAHSMGSRIAAYFCANYPDRVCGLLIEDMDMRSREPMIMDDQSLLELSGFRRAFSSMEALKEYLDEQNFFPPEKVQKLFKEPSRILKRGSDYYLGSSPYTDYLTYHQIQCSRIPLESFNKIGAGKIDFPIKVLIADNESEVTTAGLDAMRRCVPTLTSATLKDSLHSIHRTQSNAFLSELENFLETCPNPYSSKKTKFSL